MASWITGCATACPFTQVVPQDGTKTLISAFKSVQKGSSVGCWKCENPLVLGFLWAFLDIKEKMICQCSRSVKTTKTHLSIGPVRQSTSVLTAHKTEVCEPIYACHPLLHNQQRKTGSSKGQFIHTWNKHLRPDLWVTLDAGSFPPVSAPETWSDRLQHAHPRGGIYCQVSWTALPPCIQMWWSWVSINNHVSQPRAGAQRSASCPTWTVRTCIVSLTCRADEGLWGHQIQSPTNTGSHATSSLSWPGQSPL